MQCIHCGHSCKDDAVFCTQCGGRIVSAGTADAGDLGTGGAAGREALTPRSIYKSPPAEGYQTPASASSLPYSARQYLPPPAQFSPPPYRPVYPPPSRQYNPPPLKAAQIGVGGQIAFSVVNIVISAYLAGMFFLIFVLASLFRTQIAVGLICVLLIFGMAFGIIALRNAKAARRESDYKLALKKRAAARIINAIGLSGEIAFLFLSLAFIASSC